MEKFIITIKYQKAALERRWHHVPAGQRKRILLYAFGCYTVLTLIVLIHVVSQVGDNGKDILQVDHITNLVIRPVEGNDSSNKTKIVREHGK